MLQVHSVVQDTGVHWFDEGERGVHLHSIILMTYGKCLYWVEGEKKMLDKGDLLFLPQQAAYYGKSIPTVTHAKYVVTFSYAEGTAGGPALLPILEELQPRQWKTERFELLQQRFKTMFEQWNERLPYREAMCQALLLESLTHWNREIDEGHRSDVKHRHAEQMKQYVQNHYRERVTKEELGTVIDKSPNYAAVLFREMTGQTIGDYIHAERIRRAIYLLQHSRMTVADIAEYLGYCDPSYFHKVFKRKIGLPPSSYIKEREHPAQ